MTPEEKKEQLKGVFRIRKKTQESKETKTFSELNIHLDNETIEEYTDKHLEKDVFADLGKIRLEIIKEKILDGLEELDENPRQQWTSLRLEKPLLEAILHLIEKENVNKC